MAKNDKKLIEQLEERLDWYTREASDEEFDAEDVEAICTVLRKLSPEPEPFTPKEQAYQNLLERIAEEENKPEKEEDTNAGQAEPEKVIKFRGAGRRKLKAAVFFGVIILAVWILSLNMVTYATARKSLFRVIMDGIREIEIRGNEDAMTEMDEEEEPNQFYDSWADLDSEIKKVIKVPSYIPEGFKLYSVKKTNNGRNTIIVADYYDEGNGYLRFQITLWDGEIDDYYEKYKMLDEWDLLEADSNEQTVYYQHDEEYLSIFTIGDCVYRIAGNITLEELIKITEHMN